MTVKGNVYYASMIFGFFKFSASSFEGVMSSKASYEADVIEWSKQQAEFLRLGKFSELDLANLAEEIEDVGKSEQRELANRMAVLIAHLVKWQYQSERRSKSWELTITNQRKSLQRRLNRTPSLKSTIRDPEWVDDTWEDACQLASKETGIGRAVFPEGCPWSMEKVLVEDFWPQG